VAEITHKKKPTVHNPVIEAAYHADLGFTFSHVGGGERAIRGARVKSCADKLDQKYLGVETSGRELGGFEYNAKKCLLELEEGILTRRLM
jgi:hypothetical protein